MAKRRPKRIMVIDEAWKLFDVEKSCEQVATLYKQARQRNIGIISVTQKGTTKLLKVRKCRQCGCTDLRACPGGCAWVTEDLCSRCR